MKRRRTLSRIFFFLIVAVIVIYITIPFLWMVTSSLKLQRDILNLDKLIFFSPTIQNYITIFADYDFMGPMLNSIWIATVSTLLAVALGFPCAYAISSYKMRWLSVTILMVRVIPAISFLIPWYMIVSSLGMTDSYTAVILSHMSASLPFCIWIMSPFCDSIPVVIEESAIIDGCAPLRRLVSIIFPLAVPGLITVTIMAFISSWNNFMYAMVLSGAKTRTLPLTLYNFMGYSFVDWGALMAAATVIVFPVLIIAFSMQRYIIKGLTAGAVKG